MTTKHTDFNRLLKLVIDGNAEQIAKDIEELKLADKTSTKNDQPPKLAQYVNLVVKDKQNLNYYGMPIVMVATRLDHFKITELFGKAGASFEKKSVRTQRPDSYRSTLEDLFWRRMAMREQDSRIAKLDQLIDMVLQYTDLNAYIVYAKNDMPLLGFMVTTNLFKAAQTYINLVCRKDKNPKLQWVRDGSLKGENALTIAIKAKEEQRQRFIPLILEHFKIDFAAAFTGDAKSSGICYSHLLIISLSVEDLQKLLTTKKTKFTQITSLLPMALYFNQIAKAKELLKNFAFKKAINTPLPHNAYLPYYTPLLATIQADDIEATKLVLQHGADFKVAVDKTFKTVGGLMTSIGNLEMCQLVFAAGADADERYIAQNGTILGPLLNAVDKAVSTGDQRLLLLVLQFSKIRLTENSPSELQDLWTRAVMLTVLPKSSHTLRLLAQHRHELNLAFMTAKGMEDHCMVRVACALDFLEGAEILLENIKYTDLNPAEKCQLNHTIFHAIRNNNSQAIKFFAGYCGDFTRLVIATPTVPDCPLLLAAVLYQPQSLPQLLQLGLSPKQSLNEGPLKGNTIWQVAMLISDRDPQPLIKLLDFAGVNKAALVDLSEKRAFNEIARHYSTDEILQGILKQNPIPMEKLGLDKKTNTFYFFQPSYAAVAHQASDIINDAVNRLYYVNPNAHPSLYHALAHNQKIEQVLVQVSPDEREQHYLLCFELLRCFEALVQYAKVKQDLFQPESVATIRNIIMHGFAEVKPELINEFCRQANLKLANALVNKIGQKDPTNNLDQLISSTNLAKFGQKYLASNREADLGLDALFARMMRELFALTNYCQGHVEYKLQLYPDYALSCQMTVTALGQYYRLFKNGDDLNQTKLRQKIQELLQVYDSQSQDKLLRIFSYCKKLRDNTGHEFSLDQILSQTMDNRELCKLLYMIRHSKSMLGKLIDQVAEHETRACPNTSSLIL